MVPEGEERVRKSSFKEIMAENVPHLGKEIPDLWISEIRSTLKYIRIKLSKIKDKERILQAST